MSYSARLRAREAEVGRPIRVALVGAGQMGTGFAAQLQRMPGMSLAAVVDIDHDKAAQALVQAGRTPIHASTVDEARRALEEGTPCTLTDVAPVYELDIDVIVEATGVPDLGCEVAIRGLMAGKHVATLNVECDVTVGLVLAQVAEHAGRIYSICRGDEPVEAKLLVDFARDLSFDVVCAGKGKNNPLRPYDTPDDVRDEAQRKRMNPYMLCEFTDGSKTMIEMVSLANTTGLQVSKRGMHGPESTVPTLSETFALTADGGVLEEPGVVDYSTGPVAPGVFAVVRSDDAYVNHEMTYLHMGDGPYFTFYRPYHLASIEAPLTVCEIMLDGQPSLVSEHWTSECGAAAKRGLAAGDVIDRVGGYTVRGVADRAEDFRRDKAVPLGVLAGARVVRDVAIDALLTYDDVELNEESLIVKLRRLQDAGAGIDEILAAVGS